MSEATLYERLGGYDGIAGFVNDLLPRLQGDAQLGRFWQHRGSDRIAQEKQLLIDYLAASAGGPMYYAGRDMKLSHEGMGISDADWEAFLGHAVDTMAALAIPQTEQNDVASFVGSLKADIVDS